MAAATRSKSGGEGGDVGGSVKVRNRSPARLRGEGGGGGGGRNQSTTGSVTRGRAKAGDGVVNFASLLDRWRCGLCTHKHKSSSSIFERNETQSPQCHIKSPGTPRPTTCYTHHKQEPTLHTNLLHLDRFNESVADLHTTRQPRDGEGGKGLFKMGTKVRRDLLGEKTRRWECGCCCHKSAKREKYCTSNPHSSLYNNTPHRPLPCPSNP